MSEEFLRAPLFSLAGGGILLPAELRPKIKCTADLLELSIGSGTRMTTIGETKGAPTALGLGLDALTPGLRGRRVPCVGGEVGWWQPSPNLQPAGHLLQSKERIRPLASPPVLQPLRVPGPAPPARTQWWVRSRIANR